MRVGTSYREVDKYIYLALVIPPANDFIPSFLASQKQEKARVKGLNNVLSSSLATH